MSSDDDSLTRLWKVQATVNKLVLDKKRDASKVADLLQQVVDDKAVENQKFSLLKKLGSLVVPNEYDPKTQLAHFHKYYEKMFSEYDPNINDENFANPTTILKPRCKLRVNVFRQIVSGITTSEERMTFLKSQNAVLVGAQGLSLLFEQKRHLLLEGYSYASFDEKSALWFTKGWHRVPGVVLDSDGNFRWRLGHFEDEAWFAVDAFLCFTNK